MDMQAGLEADQIVEEDGGGAEPFFDLSGDERRMHVRAYNHWVSLLNGRSYPLIENLDPTSIADAPIEQKLLEALGKPPSRV